MRDNENEISLRIFVTKVLPLIFSGSVYYLSLMLIAAGFLVENETLIAITIGASLLPLVATVYFAVQLIKEFRK